MAGNQATISVAVSVQNLAKVQNLTQAFKDLRTVIIAMQRSTQGVSGMSKAIQQAVNQATAGLQQQAAATQRASTAQQNADTRAANAITARKRATNDLRKLKLDEAREANRHSEAELNQTIKLRDLRLRSLRLAFEKRKQNDKLAEQALRRQERAEQRLAADQRRNAAARQKEELKLQNIIKSRYEAQAKERDRLRQLAEEQKKLTSTLQGRLTFYEKKLDAIFRAAYRLKQVGSDLSNFGSGLLQGLKGLTEIFGEFEFMAGRAAGALGDWAIAGDGADENFRKLQDTVLASAESMRLFAAPDIAKALYFLASTTGQVVESQDDLNEVMRSLEPIMQVAALTQTDYETAIKGVYSIVSQYNSEIVRFAQISGDYTMMSQKMRDVTIKLFYAAQRTAAEFPDLVNSFKMVGPVAKQSGASFEEMLDLLGRLADLGIRGTMSGRALRQMFIQMVKPSGPAQEALNRLFTTEKNLVEFNGKNYKQLMFPKGTFVGTAQYINILARALDGASQSERNYLLARISTANELPALQALIAQEIAVIKNGGEQLSKTADMNEQAEKTFKAAWDRLKYSWNGTVASLQRGVEALQIVIGREFAEAFKPFVEQVRSIVEQIRGWAQANPQLVKEIGKLVGVFAGLTAAAGVVLTLTGSIIGLVAAGSLIAGAFAPAIPIIVTLGTLIAGIGIQLVERFDEIQVSLQAFQAEIERAFSTLVSASSDGKNAIEDVMEMFRFLADQVINAGKTILDTITAIIKAINDLGLTEPIIKGLAAALALLFGQKIIRGIQSLILSTRLFKKEMLSAWSVQTITTAQGVSQQIIAQTTVVNKLGIGYKIAALSAEAFRAVTLAATLTFPRLASIAIPAIMGIGKAIGAAASLAFGPVGIIAAFSAMIAYDMNLLGIKDIIGGIAGSTRDFNKELEDANSNLGDLALKTTNVLERTVLPGYDSVLASLRDAVVIQKQVASLGAGNTESVISVEAWGQVFEERLSTNIFASDAEKADEARQKLRERLAAFRESALADARNFIVETKDGINSLIVAGGGAPINPEELLSSVLDVSFKTNIRPDVILNAFSKTVKNFGADFSYNDALLSVKAFIPELDDTAARAIASVIFDEDRFDEALANQFAQKEIDAKKAIYAPIADVLRRAMESGNQQEVVRLLTQPVGTMIGGTFLETGKALSSLDMQLLNKLGLDTLVQGAMSGLDSSLAGEFDDTAMFEGESEASKSLSQRVQEKLSADFYNAKKDLIGPIEQLVLDFVNETSLVATKTWNEDAGRIMPAQVDALAYRRIAAQVLPDGRTIAEAFAAGDLRETMIKDFGSEYTELVIDIISGGVEAGILGVGKTNVSSWMPPTFGFTDILSEALEAQLGKSKLADIPSGLGEAVVGAISTYSFSANDKQAFIAFITKAVPGGGTILSALRAGKIPDGISEPVRRIIEEGIRRGFLSDDVLKEIATQEGAQTFQDVTRAFVDGMNSRKDTIQNIRKALKKSDPKQTRRLVRDMFGSVVGRATRAGASLEAQLYANEFLETNSTNLINTLSSTEIPKKKRRQIAQAAARQLANIDFSTLSPSQVGAISGLIPLINSLIKNDIPAPSEDGAQAGPGTSLNSWILGSFKTASESDATKTALTTTGNTYIAQLETGVAWAAGGAKVGKTWGDALGVNAVATVELWLLKLKEIVQGQSPPKKGPLRTIDRGGRNIGKAWGQAFASGATKSIMTGVAETGKELDKQGKKWSKKVDPLGRSWTRPRKNGIVSPDGRSWTGPKLLKEILGRSWTGPRKRLLPIEQSPDGRSWTRPRSRMVSPMGRSWTSPGGKRLMPVTPMGRSWTGPRRKNIMPDPNGRSWTRPSMETNIPKGKRRVEISINVRGDGSINRAQLSEVRRGVMDALVASDLEHMVEVI